MTDIPIDGAPMETPEPEAWQTYAATPPTFNRAFGAFADDTSILAPLKRSMDRDEYQMPGTIGGVQAARRERFGAPVLQSPVMSAEDANAAYAPLLPDGTRANITDKPIPDAVAQMIGEAKKNEIDREGVMARYSNAHAWPITFGTGLAAFMSDPLNAASTFIPGVGEEAISGALARVGIRSALATRLATGAAAGAIAQAPISFSRYALSQQEAGDYDLRSAFRDMFFAAAPAAVIHAGLGAAGDFFKGRRTAAPEAAPILDANAVTQHDAMQTGVGQIVNGQPVNVAPVFEALHASPHQFGEFDLSKMGTGEGAQSFGHGIYLAESPNVAGEGGHYAQKFEDRTGEPANIYRVAVAGRPELFLDWEKSLNEQSPEVQKAIRAIPNFDRSVYARELSSAPLGEAVKRGLLPGTFSPEGAAKTLSEAGIPGIRYLDEGSRGAPILNPKRAAEMREGISSMKANVAALREEIGKNRTNEELLPAFFEAREAQIRDILTQIDRVKANLADVEAGRNVTHNYVIFDPKHIKVLERNGAEITSPAQLAEWQRQLHGNGFAPGMTQAELRDAAASVYAEKPKPLETDVDKRLEDAEARLQAARQTSAPTVAESIPKPEKTEATLLQMLRKKKGMQDEGGELRAMDLHLPKYGVGKSALIRENGMDWDEAVRAAQEAGYIGEGAGAGAQVGAETLQGGKEELLDKIRREAAGEKQYPIGTAPEKETDVAAEAEMQEHAAHNAAQNELAWLNDEFGPAEAAQLRQTQLDLEAADAYEAAAQEAGACLGETGAF